MNLIHPRTGKPIPRNRVIRFPPENKNFKATFKMQHGKKVVKSTPYELEVLTSIDPETFSTQVAIALKFRDGMVISGGPLLMEIGGEDGDENEADNSGVHPAGSGADSDSAE